MLAALLLLYTPVSQKTVWTVLKMGIFWGYPLIAIPVLSSSSWDKQKKTKQELFLCSWQNSPWEFSFPKISQWKFSFPKQETLVTGLLFGMKIVLIWAAYGQAYYRAKPALWLKNHVAFSCLCLLENVRNTWKFGAASCFTNLPCIWGSFTSRFRILPPCLLFVEAETALALWCP